MMKVLGEQYTPVKIKKNFLFKMKIKFLQVIIWLIFYSSNGGRKNWLKSNWYNLAQEEKIESQNCFKSNLTSP